MTYNHYRTIYAWTAKNYPGTSNLPLGNESEMIGKMITERYEKSGSRWKLISQERDDLTTVFYLNCVDAVPFFRGLGGSERVTLGYTVLGYMPIEISSISPDKQTKIKRTFRIM